MKLLGIAGRSGSGKTTLLTALIPLLQARGLAVSSIKHAHHNLVLDQPGKDSFRHAEAGAQEVILASAKGFALYGRYEEPDISALLARLKPVDLVLVEGFKNYAMPKLEVFRPALGHDPLWREMDIQAVTSDADLPDCPLPVLPLNQPAVIVDFLLTALWSK
jgi:molybdopterin-guanine dinucleotide biosynthesis protein B